MRLSYQIINFIAWIAFLIPIFAYIIVQTYFWIKNKFYFRLFSMLCWIISVWLYIMRWSIPYDIQIITHPLALWINSKIALISDLHLWMHKNQKYAQSIVDELNSISWLNYVLIAWDWTYYPQTWSLQKVFEPFRSLRVPVFGVLWNHDVEKPWPNLRWELTHALAINGIKLLENEKILLSWFELVWLGEYMNWENNTLLLNLPRVVLSWTTLPRFVLSHNPDITLDYITWSDTKNHSTVDLTFVWHTHCWQIKFFWLEQYIMPTQKLYTDGMSQISWYNLFITCGVWETLLPMRRWTKPTIDLFILD